MSGVFVTADGFQKKTLAEIIDELEASFKGIYGNDVDLSAESPLGQQIGILSKRESDLWDLAEEIYTSRNPLSATGTSLDNIVAEIGILRLVATATQTKNVLLEGTEGTVVAASSKVKRENIDLTHSLDSAITIEKATALKLKVEPNETFPLSGGEVFSINLDSVVYDYTGGGGDTKGDVIDGLITDIQAGAFTGDVSNEDDTNLVIDGDDSDGDSIPDTSFSASALTKLTENQLASGGDFTADEAGVNAVPADSLIIIATPVSGWDTVINPGSGVTGSATETDDELRIRFFQTFLAGNATDEAIRGNLLSKVDDIISASVSSNRSLVSNTQKIIWDADFVASNNIDITVQGISVTTVPFNADQATTMDDLKAQIEGDIANTSVTVDTLDSDTRTLIITLSTTTQIQVTENVTAGASQANAKIIYSDSEGRPSKSFEAVVQGGTDADVAQVIWDSMPSGIEPYGNTTVVVVDSEGNNQSISFSRPIPKYVWLKVKRDFNSEETYPVDGDTQIKNNIVEWSLENLSPGDDVIRQRLSEPVYDVSGVGDIEITLDFNTDIGHTPVYSEKNVTVLGREVAMFDVGRIIVEVLTP